MKAKYFIATFFLATVILVSGGFAKAEATTDCMALSSVNDKITCITNLIAQLTQQVAQLQGHQGSDAAWCHTFNNNLGYANSGTDEISQLHTALQQKENISYAPDTDNTYADGTANAIVQFQAKYGIIQTGYFGTITRAKLNSLYGCATPPACSTLYWLDNTDKTCQTQKQFCGAYMYYGLQTFNTQQDCLTAAATNQTQPSITVTSPNGSEAWKVGETHDITWTSNGVDKVAIYAYGYDSTGSQTTASMKVINNSGLSASTGKYSWTISSDFLTFQNKDRVKIYLLAYTNAGATNPPIADFSDNYFSIGTTTQPSITVTSPNGGETWAQGRTYNITWNSNNLPQSYSVGISLLDYSLAGSSAVITQSTPASGGSYSWMVPSNFAIGSQYKIKIVALGLGDIEDSSDNYFSVVALSSTPSITVTSPNGGEAWPIGQIKTITWTYAGTYDTTSLDINVINYTTNQRYKIANVPVYNNSYSWTVGNAFDGSAMPAGSQYKIEIYDPKNPAYKDSSDNYFSVVATSQARCNASNQCVVGGSGVFCTANSDCSTVPSAFITATSPSGSEAWKTGETRNITWTSTGLPSGASVDVGVLNYNYYDGNTYYKIATVPASQGSYSWAISAGTGSTPIFGPTGSKFKIDISYFAGGSMGYINGISSNYFSITKPSACTPNWVCTWGQCVSGSQLQTAVDSNNCGTTTGQITCTPSSRTCGSSTQSSITVTSPTSGATWSIGSTNNITWTVPSTPNTVNIVFLYQSPSDFNTTDYITIATDVPASQGTYRWTITPGGGILPGSNYYIWIGQYKPSGSSGFWDRTTANATPWGGSSGFSIVTPGSVAVPGVDLKVSTFAGNPQLFVSNSDGPLNIAPNTEADLSWTSSNATSCSASGGWSGNKAISSTVGYPERINNITSSTTFTLTCQGPGGTTTDNVVLNVGSASPSLIFQTNTGQTGNVLMSANAKEINLVWSSSNVSSCTATGSWIGNKPVSGSAQITFPSVGNGEVYSYSLICNGGGTQIVKGITAYTFPYKCANTGIGAMGFYNGTYGSYYNSSTIKYCCSSTGFIMTTNPKNICPIIQSGSSSSSSSGGSQVTCSPGWTPCNNDTSCCQSGSSSSSSSSSSSGGSSSSSSGGSSSSSSSGGSSSSSSSSSGGSSSSSSSSSGGIITRCTAADQSCAAQCDGSVARDCSQNFIGICSNGCSVSHKQCAVYSGGLWTGISVVTGASCNGSMVTRCTAADQSCAAYCDGNTAYDCGNNFIGICSNGCSVSHKQCAVYSGGSWAGVSFVTGASCNGTTSMAPSSPAQTSLIASISDAVAQIIAELKILLGR